MGRRAIKLIKPKRKYTRRVPELPKELPELPIVPTPESVKRPWHKLRAEALENEKDEFDFEGSTYRTASGRRVNPLPTHVLVSMPVEEAEQIAFGMHDLLCWVRGYEAGRGNDDKNPPTGREQTRAMTAALDRAIRKARERGAN